MTGGAGWNSSRYDCFAAGDSAGRIPYWDSLCDYLSAAQKSRATADHDGVGVAVEIVIVLMTWTNPSPPTIREVLVTLNLLILKLWAKPLPMRTGTVLLIFSSPIDVPCCVQCWRCSCFLTLWRTIAFFDSRHRRFAACGGPVHHSNKRFSSVVVCPLHHRIWTQHCYNRAPPYGLLLLLMLVEDPKIGRCILQCLRQVCHLLP